LGELNRNSNATAVPVPQRATGTPARFASCRMTVS
jgi:hypothetical protein